MYCICFYFGWDKYFSSIIIHLTLMKTRERKLTLHVPRKTFTLFECGGNEEETEAFSVSLCWPDQQLNI